MKKYILLMFAIGILFIGIYSYLYIKGQITSYEHKVVICIPVYGQSLALGEEATRITDFDSLRLKYKGRIVNENLDYQFGGYSDKKWKRFLKRLFNYHSRSFELSLYSMAETLSSELGEDTIICIFPGGMGETPIYKLSKQYGWVYQVLLSDIKNAYETAKKRGWDFHVPAICWMQGESDIVEYTYYNYKEKLKQISTDFNKDIKDITQQKEDIIFICYQSNALTKAEKFNAEEYYCIETRVAQGTLELIRDDSLFWASGPTYPYHFVNEKIHIDAVGQQQIGKLEANAVLNILRNREKTHGVIPISLSIDNQTVTIHMTVPQPPLTFDTISIKPIKNYGFSVITPEGEDIASHVMIEEENLIKIYCSQSPVGCKIRYAVNGEKGKSGFEHGPRGNLRDSHPLRNWCYQFDLLSE